jgi:hypothetical protein
MTTPKTRRSSTSNFAPFTTPDRARTGEVIIDSDLAFKNKRLLGGPHWGRSHGRQVVICKNPPDAPVARGYDRSRYASDAPNSELFDNNVGDVEYCVCEVERRRGRAATVQWRELWRGTDPREAVVQGNHAAQALREEGWKWLARDISVLEAPAQPFTDLELARTEDLRRTMERNEIRFIDGTCEERPVSEEVTSGRIERRKSEATAAASVSSGPRADYDSSHRTTTLNAGSSVV